MTILNLTDHDMMLYMLLHVSALLSVTDLVHNQKSLCRYLRNMTISEFIIIMEILEVYGKYVRSTSQIQVVACI